MKESEPRKRQIIASTGLLLQYELRIVSSAAYMVDYLPNQVENRPWAVFVTAIMSSLGGAEGSRFGFSIALCILHISIFVCLPFLDSFFSRVARDLMVLFYITSTVSMEQWLLYSMLRLSRFVIACSLYKSLCRMNSHKAARHGFVAIAKGDLIQRAPKNVLQVPSNDRVC